LRRGVRVLALLALACAAAPPTVAPDRAGVFGTVRLVPREGVAAPGVAGSTTPYGDRRYADAELVDYTRPGFAVAYLERGLPAGSGVRLAVRAGLGGLRLEPAHGALAAGATVTVENRTGERHVVSCPEAGVLRPLEPGASLDFAAPPGELAVFVPEAPDAAAHLFAAPGAFVAVDASGRFELVDVEPGADTLHVWHPRFPPRARRIELAPGRATRVDVELGVGLPPGEESDAR
jgi:hypothetical protein